MKTAKSTPRKTDTLNNRERILSKITEPITINQVIDKLFLDDIKTGEIENRSWQYYVHLNKLFSPLEKKGLIVVKGSIKGKTGKFEKLWIKA